MELEKALSWLNQPGIKSVFSDKTTQEAVYTVVGHIFTIYEEGYIDGADDLRKEVIKYMQHLKTVHPDDVAMQRVDQEELNNCYRYLLVERYVNGGKDEENNT